MMAEVIAKWIKPRALFQTGRSQVQAIWSEPFN